MSIQAGLKERAYAIAEMARTPEQIKAAQRTLSQSVQDGTLPSYVGIPLISELNMKMAKASAPPAAAAPMQQPPIAQQVMQQAQADQGVATLPSGLPEQEMAGGGIVAFAAGGDTDRRMIEALLGKDEDESDEDYDEMVEALSSSGRMPDFSSILKMVEDANLPSDEGIESLSPVESKTFMTRSPEGAAVENVTKREGDGTVQIEHDKKAVSGMDGLLQHVLAKESGGRRFDKLGNLLTSPKGAQGEMQVMPGTQLDPGFGVTPARDRSPDEIARVGRDYLRAMRERYGDDKLAAIAYNMGPGATDKWLAAGADPARLPAETRGYIQGMAGGGAVHFQNRGLVDLFDMSADEIKDLARRKLRMDQARSAFSAMPEPVAPVATPAAAAEAPAAGAKGMGRFGRVAGPLGIATLGYDVGKNVLESKQADELKKYGPEPDLTPEEIERASRPAFMKDVSMSPKEQQDRGIKPLAPLTYTPAGVQTYGPRAGYTPPTDSAKKPVATLPPTGAGAARGSMRGPSFEDLAQQAREQELAANQEASDLEEGRAMERFQKMAEEEGKKEKPEAEAPKSKLEQLLEARMGRLDKQREEDKYLALLSAGLGMMGGTSPYAGANIGQGAQAGIASYLRSGATRAAEENAILSAPLGLERYKGLADIRKQGLESQKAIKEMDLALRGKIAEGQERQRIGAQNLQQQKIYQGRLEQIEKLAQNQALAEFKGALLPEQKEQILSKAINDLRTDPGYRDLYKKVHGFDPMPAKSGNTISWGQLTQ